MTVPFVNVRPKAIKLKVLPHFPASLNGRNGIDVAKENGNWFVDLDYAKFLPAIPSAPASAVMLVWDEATNQYRLVPASSGGIPDAPNDGTQYGRQSLTWTPIAASAPPPDPATATPLVESGTGAVGTSVKYAREDHVHPAGGGGGGSTVYAQDTPPVGAAAGSLWWESDTGNLYIYFNDGTSSQWVAISSGGAANSNVVRRSYLAGLTLSTAGGSATFSVAAGEAADSGNAFMMALAAAISKTTAAWAAGTGNGAWDGGGANPATTGATWFHVYLIRRPDTGVVDVALSQNASAPVFGVNIPAAYTQYRRIGSMKTAAANVWTKFIQDGDRFMWDVPIQDVPATANPGTAAQTRTISTPLGVRTRAIVVVVVDATNASTDGPINIYVSDLSVTDSIPGSAVKNVQLFTPGITTEIAYGGLVEVMTNTSSQIRCRINQSAAGTIFFLNTNGWFDSRGRDA